MECRRENVTNSDAPRAGRALDQKRCESQFPTRIPVDLTLFTRLIPTCGWQSVG